MADDLSKVRNGEVYAIVFYQMYLFIWILICFQQQESNNINFSLQH